MDDRAPTPRDVASDMITDLCFAKRKSLGTVDSLTAAWDQIDEMKVNRIVPGWIDPSAGRVLFEAWASAWIRDRHQIRTSTRNQY